ncbi:phage terminase small subunit [Serratia marcescens]|uniref:phage terminase small subunit n=1 Tax=Serratia marcescens TaxID=615 RepID=UPI00217815CD|nr:phage terminase small subunit [Serratia marcescens]CAI1968966.1 Phage small terminase subunit [Serratia marcescens]
MMTPARRHFLRETANAVTDAEPLSRMEAGTYSLMLRKLAEDKRSLARLQGSDRRIAFKRKVMPDYAPWIGGVLQSGKGTQDDVLVTVMIWLIDIGEPESALPLAGYALKSGLTAPGYDRQLATIIAEEIANAALTQHSLSQPLDLAVLQHTLELTAGEDMPDEARAKLLKALGYALEQDGQHKQAVIALEQALRLNQRAGVKKDITRLNKADE